MTSNCKYISQIRFLYYLGKNRSLRKEKFLPAQEKIFLCAGKNKSGARRTNIPPRTKNSVVNKIHVSHLIDFKVFTKTIGDILPLIDDAKIEKKS